MSKIVTLTLNPAVDKSTQVANIVPDQKLRCENPKYEPGGGGINVSRALKRLGTDSIAIFPAGGRTGKLFQELLLKENIEQCVIETRNETRENFTVVDSHTNQQYRFGMPGMEIYAEEEANLISQIKEYNPEWLVVSGSLPPGIQPEFLGTIATICKENKTKLIVDTSGDALRFAVDKGVFMLKPNLGELSRLVGAESLDNKSVNEAAKELVDKGKCEIVVVSMGPQGARLVAKNKIEHVSAPVVKKLSTVGAGDSMVAGMVHALFEGYNLRDVVRMGVACGTAATMNSGTELFKITDVERLYQWLAKKEEG